MPKDEETAQKIRDGILEPGAIPEEERDYYLERKYPSFGNLVPRDLASRNAKEVCDDGYGVGSTGDAVYLDFSDAISRLGKDAIKAKYGNLFEMYNRITDDDPYMEAYKPTDEDNEIYRRDWRTGIIVEVDSLDPNITQTVCSVRFDNDRMIRDIARHRISVLDSENCELNWTTEIDPEIFSEAVHHGMLISIKGLEEVIFE